MNEQEKQAIRERCDKSTSGPWGSDNEEWPGNDNLNFWINTHLDGLACAVTKEDAEFITHARTDIPRLLYALDERDRELREGTKGLIKQIQIRDMEIERLRKALERISANLCEDYREEAYQALNDIR